MNSLRKFNQFLNEGKGRYPIAENMGDIIEVNNTLMGIIMRHGI